MTIPLPTLRILRPIVFAGALEGPEALVACEQDGLAEQLVVLRGAGLIEDLELLVPTDAGTAALEQWYANDRAAIPEDERDAIIDRFRPLDIEVKRLSTAWLDAEDKDDWDARMAVIEGLGALQQNTRSFVLAHQHQAPRWTEFADRLQTALDAVLEGDTDYVVSVRHPSYHTIWFEFHEDLLRTLERKRDAE